MAEVEEHECLDDSADIFANSSAETVTEVSLANLSAEDVSRLDSLAQQLSRRKSPEIVSPPPPLKIHSTDTSFVLANFLSETICKPPDRIYCPFCADDFGFEFLLKAHIKDVHLVILHKILKSTPDEVSYQECPFCDAKFYGGELLPRHILGKHQQNVVSMMASPGGPSQLVRCLFCPHRILRRHYPLLNVHIEKKHFNEFEEYVIKKYSKLAASCDDLRFLGESQVKITTQVVSPDLNQEMRNLRMLDDKVIYSKRPVFIKPILKVGCPRSDSKALLSTDIETSPGGGALSDRMSAMRLAKQACRRLRFDLPDSPPQVQQAKRFVHEKMRQAFAKRERKFKWKFSLFRKKKGLKKQDSVSLLSSPRVTPVKPSFKSLNTSGSSTPLNASPSLSEPSHLGSSSNGISRFSCGACGERYPSNGPLVQHVRRHHRKIIFRLLYGCGECDAKFYRNNPLVKHSVMQHSPLCLKGKGRRSPTAKF